MNFKSWAIIGQSIEKWKKKMNESTKNWSVGDLSIIVI